MENYLFFNVSGLIWHILIILNTVSSTIILKQWKHLCITNLQMVKTTTCMQSYGENTPECQKCKVVTWSCDLGSQLNIRRKGEKPVVFCFRTRILYATSSMKLSQLFSCGSVSLAIRILKVRLTRSVNPFVCGWYAEVMLLLMPYLVHNSLLICTEKNKLSSRTLLYEAKLLLTM